MLDTKYKPVACPKKDRICFLAEQVFTYILTLKVPNKNCSRRHFNFLLLSFIVNIGLIFHVNPLLAEDSLETSRLICSEKQ